MFKSFKRVLAIVLSVALLATTVIVSGVFTVSAEDVPSPYPVYSDIDFSKYTVVGGASGNSYTGKYDDGSNAVYWKEVSDPSADGGKFIRYDTTKVIEGSSYGATTWLGNHAFVPSETGARTTLPANTTFKVTYKIRTNEVGVGINGFVSFINTPGSLNSVASGTVTWAPKMLRPTEDWTEYSFTFTTPSEEKACYLGFNAVGEDGVAVKIGYCYDIDRVKLEIVNNESLRIVDFSSYDVNKSGIWGPSAGEGTGKTDTWAHVYKDETLSGDSYYNYYGKLLPNNQGINSWYGHYGIAPTISGSVTTSGDMKDGNNVVLPNNTTYRLSVRVRVNEVSGATALYRSFTSGQSTKGDVTVIAPLSVTDGWVTYTDVFTTPATYNGSNNRFYLSIYNNYVGDMNVDIDYIKLEKLDTVSITFNANGGNFGGAASVTETAVVGDAPEVAATITAPDKYSALIGWSTTADGAEIVTAVTKDMDGKTLYAVWNRDAHAGGYQDSVTVYGFESFNPTSNSTFNFTDSQGATRLYWNKGAAGDTTTEDGYYLRYEALNGKASNWMGNHALALSEQGNTKIVLPTSTTYEMTLRVRGVNLPSSGMYPWIAYCDSLRGFQSSDYINDSHYTTFTTEKVTTTGEWTEVTVKFTTPETYSYNATAKATFDKFFLGFYTGTSGVNYAYDLDTVTLKVVTNTEFYVDSDNDGNFELYSTVTGTPGDNLPMPKAEEVTETYNLDATGYTSTYKFDKWYSDVACTQDAILKFGNFDVKLYCKPAVSSTTSEGQVGFAGFDQYYELSSGMCINPDNAAITTEDAYSGTSSLKFTLSAGEKSYAELTNNETFDIKVGQSYKVTFKYKAAKDFTAAVATGEHFNTAGGKNIFGAKSVDLSATDTWQTATLIVDTDSSVNYVRGAALAFVATSDVANEIFIDTVVVSAVTEGITAVKTENGIRFMMLYNCGGDNTIVLEDEEYTITEHGVLVTGANNETALIMENAGKNGVIKVSQTDASKYFGRNEATKATTYSVLLEGVSADNDYEFTARGYVKFENGDVYYTDFVTSSAVEAKETFKLNVPESAIVKGNSASYGQYESTAHNNEKESYYVYLPAGTVIYSEKNYYVERWGSPASSWINPNYFGTGNYVMDVSAYCELTVYGGGSLNNDLKITVPPESAHLAAGGFMEDYSATGVMQRFEPISDSSINYIFITDLHTGAFLRKDASGTYWTAYEPEAEVLSRETWLKNRIENLVTYANNNDDIDFICIGGDSINGYETEFSPMYQKALAEGKVANVREYLILQMQTIFEPLKDSTKPVFILTGNHDSNEGQSQFYNDYNKQNNITNGYSLNNAEILSDRDWLNGIMKEYINVEIVQDPNYKDTNGDLLSKYYYYDLEKNGEDTRIICLDDIDSRHVFDPVTGEIIERTSGRRMAYTPEQLQWLANALKTASGDVLILSHQGTDGNTEGAANGNILAELLGAFQNKKAYVNEAFGINVDFSTGYTGNVIAYSYGHTHVTETYYDTTADVWLLNCAMGQSDYDIVSASKELVKKYNYSGKDATLFYPEFP